MHDLRHDPDTDPRQIREALRNYADRYANAPAPRGALFDDAPTVLNPHDGSTISPQAHAALRPACYLTPVPRNAPVTGGAMAVSSTGYMHAERVADLRTADQKESDDIAALSRRVETLEEAVTLQADVLQVLLSLLLRLDEG
jgi:hypothetical protein